MYAKYSSLWCLKNAPVITNYLFAITDEDKLLLVKDIIEKFKEIVLTTYNTLQLGKLSITYLTKTIYREFSFTVNGTKVGTWQLV